MLSDVVCDINALVLSIRCMMDSDDEVRDRATFYMNVLQQKQKALNAAYIFNGNDPPDLGYSVRDPWQANSQKVLSKC